jgi:hypothetical protein
MLFLAEADTVPRRPVLLFYLPGVDSGSARTHIETGAYLRLSLASPFWQLAG